MIKPKTHAGLHHLALNVTNFAACAHFYIELLGMKIVWQPDEDNLYLSSGNDNLALHKAAGEANAGLQRLDHLGFFLQTPEEVDEWHKFLLANNIKMKAAPKNHRDGTRSFYCFDPDGNTVQMIYVK